MLVDEDGNLFLFLTLSCALKNICDSFQKLKHGSKFSFKSRHKSKTKSGQMTIELMSNGFSVGEDTILVRRHVAPIGVLKVAFSALATLTVSIALVFAAQGLWLVLPYAAVECFAIGAAYWWIMRERDDFERITRDGDLVRVRTRISGFERTQDFNRFWVSVQVIESGVGRCQLVLSSHGNHFEIGRLLPPEKRRGLADQIRSMFTV